MWPLALAMCNALLPLSWSTAASSMSWDETWDCFAEVSMAVFNSVKPPVREKYSMSSNSSSVRAGSVVDGILIFLLMMNTTNFQHTFAVYL